MDFFIPILNTLAIAVILILLMVGLMSAPWQVLLLILVLGILAYQWLIRRHHLQSVLKDINATMAERQIRNGQPEATIQPAEPTFNRVLHYRGASYNAAEPSSESSHPTVEPTVEIIGQYRGGTRKFSL